MQLYGKKETIIISITYSYIHRDFNSYTGILSFEWVGRTIVDIFSTNSLELSILRTSDFQENFLLKI